jgi:agmatinase
MEVVEVSPPYDQSEITAMLANRLVIEALSGVALRRLERAPQPERSG